MCGCAKPPPLGCAYSRGWVWHRTCAKLGVANGHKGGERCSRPARHTPQKASTASRRAGAFCVSASGLCACKAKRCRRTPLPAFVYTPSALQASHAHGSAVGFMRQSTNTHPNGRTRPCQAIPVAGSGVSWLILSVQNPHTYWNYYKDLWHFACGCVQRNEGYAMIRCIKLEKETVAGTI